MNTDFARKRLNEDPCCEWTEYSSKVGRLLRRRPDLSRRLRDRSTSGRAASGGVFIPNSNRSSRRAFTLFELLIAMSMIAIIGGASYYALGRSSEESDIRRAANTLHAMIRVARAQAIMNSTYSRLIVNNDQTDSERYLRTIGVMIQDDSTTDYWKAIERSEQLPEGVYLVPQGSSPTAASLSPDWPTDAGLSIYKTDVGAAHDTAVFKFDYPVVDPVDENTTDAPRWIAIQFAPNGRLSSARWGGGNDLPSNNQLVLGIASWVGGTLSFREPGKIVGLRFKPSGSSYLVEEATVL